MRGLDALACPRYSGKRGYRLGALRPGSFVRTARLVAWTFRMPFAATAAARTKAHAISYDHFCGVVTRALTGSVCQRPVIGPSGVCKKAVMAAREDDRMRAAWVGFPGGSVVSTQNWNFTWACKLRGD